jgi:FkbM family methyltransferase
MLDIGANIGTTSIPLVVLGDFQQVYAAEPEPANFACLVQNTIANGLEGLVLPDCVAIGSSNGERTFLRAPRIGGHRLATNGDMELHPELMMTVPCRTLDSWIASLGIDLDAIAYIKCDVQGWEPHVLAGAAAALAAQHIVWEVEVSPKHLTEAGSSVRDLCELLRRHFSRHIDVGRSDARPRPISELEASLDDVPQARRYTNLLVYNVA